MNIRNVNTGAILKSTITLHLGGKNTYRQGILNVALHTSSNKLGHNFGPQLTAFVGRSRTSNGLQGTFKLKLFSDIFFWTDTSFQEWCPEQWLFGYCNQLYLPTLYFKWVTTRGLSHPYGCGRGGRVVLSAAPIYTFERQPSIVLDVPTYIFCHLLALHRQPNVLTVTLTHWVREKWPPFSRRHFEMHFLKWTYMSFD